MTDSKVNVTGFLVKLEITEYGTRATPPASLFGVATRQETSRNIIALEVDVDTIAEARDAIYRNVYAALPFPEEELAELDGGPETEEGSGSVPDPDDEFKFDDETPEDDGPDLEPDHLADDPSLWYSAGAPGVAEASDAKGDPRD